MIRTTYILLWEQWRQTWKALLAMLLVLLGYGAALYLIDDFVRYVFAHNYSLAVGTAYLPVVGAIVFTFLQDNRNRTGFAYPRRMLFLPAHTATLVAVQMAYKIAVAVAFTALAGWLLDNTIKVLFYHTPQLLFVPLLVVVLQALVFLVCGFGASTGLALFILAAALTSPFTYLVYQEMAKNMGIPPSLPPMYQPPEFSPYAPAWAVAGIVIWWSIGWYGARHARSTIPEDPIGRFTKTLGSLAFFERRHDTFASPADAQRWFEWRRGAYLYPWVTLGTGIALLAVFSVTLTDIESRFMVTFNLLAVAPAVVAALTGYTLTRSTDDYLWFAGPRPLTTATMARARLRAAVKGILLGYAMLLVVFLVAYRLMFPGQPILAALITDLRVMTSTSGSSSESAAMLAAIAVLIVLSVWALFWLARSAGVFVWLAGAVAGVWYLFSGRLYIETGDDGFIITPALVFAIALAAIMALAAIVSYAIALKLRLTRPSIALLALAGWLLSCLLLLPFREMFKAGTAAVCIIALALPFAPFATVPLTWHWQRHR